MLITSGTETSGISHALAYIASLRLATPAHGHDRSAPYWARHLRKRLTLAYTACQYKPLRLTMAIALTRTKKHPAEQGAISRVFAKSAY